MSIYQIFNLKKAGLSAGIVIGCLLVIGSSVWAAPDHSLFAELLAAYNRGGHVDYAGLKTAESKLVKYLDEMSGVDPNSLSPPDRFAFYVNAYNAWTIKLVLSGYPGVKSIKDFGNIFRSPWKLKFVVINGEKITLDNIEHDILRPQYKDPRVHFVINCAALGCPRLFHEPLTGSRLELQLERATREFINDNHFNRLEGDTLFVSKIFKWFKEDFNNDVIGFFEQYAADDLKQRINERRTKLKISYLNYDWGLNGN